MREGNISSLSTLAGGGGGPHYSQVWTGEGVLHPKSRQGCTPIQVRSQVGMGGRGTLSRSGQGVPPAQDWMSYPPGLDGVPPPPRRQSSIASACYAAGGMPLAGGLSCCVFLF